MIDFITTQETLYRILKDAKLKIDPKLANHQRACAELIEEFVQDNLIRCIPNTIKSYEEAKTAKALADISCYDEEDNYYAFDVKTHNVAKWGMPNIVSYKKLDKFYKESKNFFVLILVNYSVDSDGIISPDDKLTVCLIESIPWKFLTVQGTLGQIQIINSNKYSVLPAPFRPAWMDEFYHEVQIGIRKKIFLLEKELNKFSTECA